MVVFLAASLLAHSPHRSSTLSASATAASCPKSSPPLGVLYNHLSKTGGTTLKYMLQTLLNDGGLAPIKVSSHAVPSAELATHPPNGALIVQDDITNLQLEAYDAENFFTIAAVRRPCDYAVSYWTYSSDLHHGTGQYEGTTPPYDGDTDVANFHLWRKEQSDDSSMTKSLAKRIPDESLVHCWVRTNHMLSDVQQCMTQFQSCGGNVTFGDTEHWAALAAEVAEGEKIAEKNDAVDVSNPAAHRMTSRHVPCSSYYNTTMMADMLADEQSLITRRNLGSCCS
jgi:hypothetical protein